MQSCGPLIANHACAQNKTGAYAEAMIAVAPPLLTVRDLGNTANNPDAFPLGVTQDGICVAITVATLKLVRMRNITQITSSTCFVAVLWRCAGLGNLHGAVACSVAMPCYGGCIILGMPCSNAMQLCWAIFSVR